MAWEDPKIDWTADNTLEYYDMNRIESNTDELATLLRAIQYDIPALTVVTGRDVTSIDFVSGINRVENNIETIKDNFFTPEGYETKKTWAVDISFSYLDAIRLENNLKLLYEFYQTVYDNLIYCGTFYCGETAVIHT